MLRGSSIASNIGRNENGFRVGVGVLGCRDGGSRNSLISIASSRGRGGGGGGGVGDGGGGVGAGGGGDDDGDREADGSGSGGVAACSGSSTRVAIGGWSLGPGIVNTLPQ
ncbi:MAG TPA: hypothetical protein DD670_00465 [Planctomycetaceae bacterium]|nr:hypothetical protein [Planctomycetaceae bacterium]